MSHAWKFDLVHSTVGFSVRHLMVSKVQGRFQQWSGTLDFDERSPETARLEVEIDAASIDTKNEQRDNHLRSADFFDAEKYPHLAFRSTTVRSPSHGQLEVEGDLTIHGVTRRVVLGVEYAGRVNDPWGGERAGFSARTAISRKDFGLLWNQALEAGGVAVGDRVDINLELEVIREAAAEKKEAVAAA